MVRDALLRSAPHHEENKNLTLRSPPKAGVSKDDDAGGGLWFAACQEQNSGRASMRMFQVCVCGQPLQLNEQPTPKPTGSEVLLKVLAAGVCHSDLHLADGWFDLGGGERMSLADRGMKLPVTLGHENVGEVVAVGPDAKGVKVGARML